MARIVRTSRPARAVCTLGRTSALTAPRLSDGREIHAAQGELQATLRAYFADHADVTSIQVVACKRHGGFTVDQYDRGDL